MQTESLEILEKADVPAGQARAIVRAIEIEIAGARDALATKHDVLVLRQEISSLQSGLLQKMSGVQSEIRQEITDVRSGLRQEITDVRNGLRQEMAELRGELKAEIHASASSITRQMYASLLGQMAVLLGIAYFFITHLA